LTLTGEAGSDGPGLMSSGKPMGQAGKPTKFVCRPYVFRLESWFLAPRNLLVWRVL